MLAVLLKKCNLSYDTIDKETLAITAGSLQDVGTTTGEVGYTGAGAYTGGSNCALVYDEDTEQVVHVRSYPITKVQEI